MSGLLATSSAAVRLLSNYFGEDTPFTAESPGMPGVVRSFASFSAALDELRGARVWAGIHFRTADDEGQKMGFAVADWIMITHALDPVHGRHEGQIGH